MTLPNLIGCGAGKSGTTSLYYYLGQHPQIFMAAAKELHFFSRHYSEGISWYESFFTGSETSPIIGEFSTSYMLDSTVPERIASLVPDAKLLFILRNPIERAYSNYWFSVSIGTQDRSQSFSDVIRTKTGFNRYIYSGFYYHHLSRFMHYISPSQIYVMITEELKLDPIKQMSMCYEFLEVDKNFKPNVDQQYNITLTTENYLLGKVFASWVNRKQQIKPLLKKFPTNLRRNLALLEKRVMHKVMSNERPSMTDTDFDLLQHEFSEQNQKLAEFIGRELSCWY